MLCKIFEPIKIGNLELKNRLVVSAMVTQYCNKDGTATEKYIAYHEAKAKGGWGLVITENHIVTKDAGCFRRIAGLWNDEQIPSHKALTERIHKAGGKICAQIYHAGRVTTSNMHNGIQSIAPSAIKEPIVYETPRAMTQDEVLDMIEKFGDCALRVKKAGFDAVEVHGAHGYLINQFLSPFSNKRCDEFGGTIQNRARFAVEIIKDIRKKAGNDFPILFRISTCDYTEGGLNLEESKLIAQMVVNAGVNLIHCSQGTYSSMQYMIPPSAVPKANFVENAAAIKSVVDVPVIATGRINEPMLAESILRSGKADMVTMARASLADPEMPSKAKEGRFDDIIHCIGCCQGCAGSLARGEPIRCLVNPMTGKEDEYDLMPNQTPKKVYVAGGGVTGSEAAIAASKIGHDVTIFEQDSTLGGQWIPAAVPIGKDEYNSFTYWQQLTIKKLGVKVVLNQVLTKDIVAEDKPDAVIIATGSKPYKPHIEGLGSDIVVSANDVLTGCKTTGKKIVVMGGGLVGAETADHLAVHGCEVTIIEMLPEIIRDVENIPKIMLMARLKKYGVAIHTSTKLKAIRGDQVIAEKDGEEIVINGIDTVIASLGVQSYNTLEAELADLPCKVVVAGDAFQVKKGLKNIQEGFEAGLYI